MASLFLEYLLYSQHCAGQYIYSTMKSATLTATDEMRVTGIEVSDSLSELVVDPLTVGNTGGRTVQGRVPF